MNQMRDKNGLTEAEFLASYDASIYPHPSLTVDNLIFASRDGVKKVLLIKRGGHPCIGMWALPGGFVGPNETTEQASMRELYEETHLRGVIGKQLYTVSTPGRDKRCWTVSVCYLSNIDADALEVRADDDADAAGWFEVTWNLLKADAAPGSQKDIYALMLTLGETVLTAKIAHTVTMTGYGERETVDILENDGIAFDHAMLIARGLLTR